jgi:hypothetical protein
MIKEIEKNKLREEKLNRVLLYFVWENSVENYMTFEQWLKIGQLRKQREKEIKFRYSYKLSPLQFWGYNREPETRNKINLNDFSYNQLLKIYKNRKTIVKRRKRNERRNDTGKKHQNICIVNGITIDSKKILKILMNYK